MRNIVHKVSILAALSSAFVTITLGRNLDITGAILFVGLSLTLAIVAVATKK